MTWSAPRLRPTMFVALAVFVVAGLMFAVAATTSQGTDLRAQRATELRDLVRQKQQRVEAWDARVSEQRQAVQDLAAGRSGNPEVAELASRVDGLSAAAGLTPVSGPGLRVTLNDAPARDPGDPLWQAISPDDVIVHQADVQAVVNAMWQGGASAVQVMDQRIVSSTAIRCVGNTLLLQGRVYSPPYRIAGIGPIKQLRAALRKDPTVAAYRDWAKVVGLGYEVKQSRAMTIPAYDGPMDTQYATPAVAASPSGSPQ